MSEQPEPSCNLHDQHMDKCITQDLVESSAGVRENNAGKGESS